MKNTCLGNDNKEMILIPEGPFLMGSEEFGMESPLRIVTLKSYYIDKYPVTNSEFKNFVDSTKYDHLPHDWKNGCFPEGKEDYPVQVTWHDAATYAKWADKRLCTEAEWEKAARGTDGRRWPWGNEFSEELAQTWESYLVTGEKSVSVYTHKEGASPYGVCDMVGNLEEWVADWLDAYPDSSYHSYAYGKKFKVLRGGAWIFCQDHARCSYRCYERPHGDFDHDAKDISVGTDSQPWAEEMGGPGFRCVMDINEGEAV